MAKDAESENIPLSRITREHHEPHEKYQEYEYTGWPFSDGVNANTIIRTAMCFTIFWGSVLVSTLVIYVVFVRSSLIFGFRYSDEHPMAVFCFIMILSGTGCVIFAVWTMVGAFKAKQQGEESNDFSRSQIKQTTCSECETLKNSTLPVYNAVRERSLSEPNIWNKSKRGFRKIKFCISERDVEKIKKLSEKCRQKKLKLSNTNPEECLIPESQSRILESEIK